jgi:hypothetical protein
MQRKYIVFIQSALDEQIIGSFDTLAEAQICQKENKNSLIDIILVTVKE